MQCPGDTDPSGLPVASRQLFFMLILTEKKTILSFVFYETVIVRVVENYFGSFFVLKRKKERKTYPPLCLTTEPRSDCIFWSDPQFAPSPLFHTTAKKISIVVEGMDQYGHRTILQRRPVKAQRAFCHLVLLSH